MLILIVCSHFRLSGASPFLGESQQETYANIVACDYEFDEEFFKETSELAKDFIRKLFVREQRRRSTVDECLKHPWIQPTSDKDTLMRKETVINIDNFKNFHARRRWKVWRIKNEILKVFEIYAPFIFSTP